jgi:hypothetical protein
MPSEKNSYPRSHTKEDKDTPMHFHFERSSLWSAATCRRSAKAPTRRRTPKLQSEEGKKNIRETSCLFGTPGQAWSIYLTERGQTCKLLVQHVAAASRAG